MNKNTENQGSKALYGLGADASKNVASFDGKFDAAGYSNMLKTLNSNHAAVPAQTESMLPAKENVPRRNFAVFNPQMKESQNMFGNSNENLLKAELNKLFPSGLQTEVSPDLNLNMEFASSGTQSFVSNNGRYGGTSPTGTPQNIWASQHQSGMPTTSYGNSQLSVNSEIWGNASDVYSSSSVPVNRESSVPNVTAIAAPSSFDVNQAIAALAAHAASSYTGKPASSLGNPLNTGTSTTSGIPMAIRTAFADPATYSVPVAPPPTPTGPLPTPISAYAPSATYSRNLSAYPESPMDPNFPQTSKRQPPKLAGLYSYSHEAAVPSPALLNPIQYANSYQNSNLGTPITPVTPMFSPTSVSSTSYGNGSYGYSNQSDWEQLLDQILIKCDQQCSMNMQNKIKTADPYEMEQIAEAILKHLFPLMVNRTGNFLVQRLLEHGPPDTVARLAQAITGNIVVLSMDQYACHVVQKAFEQVPEHFKLDYIKELLADISLTMNNKHAAHVWQKLFELRWKGPAPKVMPFVNRDLKGQWPRIANGETGSLVVQNVFENCIEDDKLPCVTEILDNLEQVAKGQFGNWCVQHIIEHGAEQDQDFIITFMLEHATDWSMDQYASKCVEKALKVGDGRKFVERYLDKVCEPELGRSRVPLIDISGDQYGNYLIQWVICNHTQESKDRIANHVRKHMVSLRGSKFGSRVAIACTNYHSQTRPGPATGISPLRGIGFGRNGPGEGPPGGPFAQSH